MGMSNIGNRYSLVLRVGFVCWTLGTGLKLLFSRNTSKAVYYVVLALGGAGVGFVHQPGEFILCLNLERVFTPKQDQPGPHPCG